MIYRYFHNLFIAIDQFVNTLIGGDPDETFSSRVGKCQRGDHGFWWQCVGWPVALIVNLIFCWQGWNHCRNCIEDDEGANELIVKV